MSAWSRSAMFKAGYFLAIAVPGVIAVLAVSLINQRRSAQHDNADLAGNAAPALTEAAAVRN